MSHTQPTHATTHATTLEGRKALIVEDDPLVARVLRRWLERDGAEVEVATKRSDALALAGSLAPDLVIAAEGLGGPRFAYVDAPLVRQLRDAGGPDLALLVLVELEDGQVDCLDQGADDVLTRPLSAPVLLARCRNLLRMRDAQRDARRLAGRLSQYVPTAVRDSGLHRRAEREELTILFTDLRSFTETANSAAPEVLFSAVDHLLRVQAEEVHAHGGYVDKFSGDGLLAVFDRPFDAIAAACAILRWSTSGVQLGPWTNPPIGIGVHAGAVLRGDVGSARRREFTVVGPVVNFAARLCGAARGHQLLCSEAIWRDLPEGSFPMRPQGLTVKGFRGHVRAYGIRGEDLLPCELPSVSAA